MGELWILENIVYNELIYMGYSLQVYYDGKEEICYDSSQISEEDANRIIDEFKNGKIGKITLDEVPTRYHQTVMDGIRFSRKLYP